jgi:uncharacterized repeat protein (TIGR02543 family)
MGRRVLWLAAGFVLALVLAVGSASGRSLFTTTVTVQVVGEGTVTSSPAGITCVGPDTCSFPFTGTSTIVLTPSNTASDWTFGSWVCSGTNEAVFGDSCQITPDITMDTSHNVTATFTFSPPPPPPPSAATIVGVSVVGKGRVTSSPEAMQCGDGKDTCYRAFSGSVTLTANDTVSGWTFDHWEDKDAGDGSAGPCDGSGSSTCAVPDAEEHAITAFYAGPPTGTKTLSVSTNDSTTTGGEGVVRATGIECGTPAGATCSWTVLSGSLLTVLEIPGSGSVFHGWSADCDGTSVSCTLGMGSDRTAHAEWDEATAATTDLTVIISGNGTVKGGNVNCSGPSTCTEPEPVNETVTLTATPKDGFVLTGWTGACTGAAPTCTLTMDVDRSVTATFTPAVQLTVNVTGNGNISGATGAINCGNGATICSASFAVGTTVTLIATPATGATFTAWTDACGGSATTCTVSMSVSRNVNATFTGGPAPGTTTVALTVSVTGNGTVTGGGIRCGSTSTVCTANQALNTVVTLTATPDPGATFTGWGGACLGTSACIVTMTAAKSVSAAFAGGTAPQVQLVVSVAGKGSVKGGAIACGNGLTACSTSLAPGTTVTLTATPATGAKFTGWGQACFGTKTTCTVTVTSSTSVTASFTGAGGTTGGTTLTALGRPLVRRSATGYLVTLRFRTTLAGNARVRGTRAGRLITSLAVHVPAGNAKIGPFPVAKSGFFTFQVTLGTHALRWRACLGLCGAAATAPPFTLARQTPIVTHTGAVWSVTLRFRASAISDDHIIVRRGGKFLSDHHFLAGARGIVVGPFLLGPGNYTLTLRAVDAYGRVRTLSWIVDLAR